MAEDETQAVNALDVDAAHKALEEARLAFESAKAAAAHLAAALGSGKEAAPELARQARERLGAFADAAPEAAVHAAEEPLAMAKAYVSDRARERPLTTVAAALGAGFFLGVLLTGHRR